MKALATAAENIQQRDTDMEASILINGRQAASLGFDKSNVDVVRFVDMGSDTVEGYNVVEIKRSGTGNIRYELVKSYYNPWGSVGGERALRLDLDYGAATMRVNEPVPVSAKVTWTGLGKLKMLIADLGVPPGFTTDVASLNTLKEQGSIDRYELEGNRIVIYIPELDPNSPLEIGYTLRAQYPVNVKTPESKVYEYYNPYSRDTAAPVQLTAT
ncbi:MAG: hypothetical protein V1875_07240 [Candidatus Altiarchaeota archaeon]